MSFRGKVNITTKTPIFRVPRTPSNDDDDYSVEKSSYFKHDEQYTIEAYSTGKEELISDIIIVYEKSSNYDLRIGVVEKITAVLDEDGEQVSKISLQTYSGQQSVIAKEQDMVNAVRPEIGSGVYKLKMGDIIKYRVKNNMELFEAALVYDSAPAAAQDGIRFSNTMEYAAKDRIYFGRVYEKQEDVIGVSNIFSGGVMTRDLERQKYIDICKGVVYNEETGKVMMSIDAPETIDQIQTANRFYQKGYIAKDAASKQDYMAEAKSGKYAVLPGTGAFSEDGSKSTGVYGYPCVETLLGYMPVSTESIMGSMTALSRTSKNPEKAIKMLNLIWKDRYLSNTLAYGIEGVNYEVKSGKGTDEISVIPKSGKEQTWGIWHNWIGPLWDQWDSPWNSTESLKEMQIQNEAAKTSVILGFMLDVEPIKNELAQISAVHSEASPIFSTGSMPDVDKYIAAIRQKYIDAGMDKVLAEAQRQLDEWKITNNR